MTRAPGTLNGCQRSVTQEHHNERRKGAQGLTVRPLGSTWFLTASSQIVGHIHPQHTTKEKGKVCCGGWMLSICAWRLHSSLTPGRQPPDDTTTGCTLNTRKKKEGSGASYVLSCRVGRNTPPRSPPCPVGLRLIAFLLFIFLVWRYQRPTWQVHWEVVPSRFTLMSTDSSSFLNLLRQVNLQWAQDSSFRTSCPSQAVERCVLPSITMTFHETSPRWWQDKTT